MRTLIFGAGGWLAGHYARYFAKTAITSEADVTDYADVWDAIWQAQPDVVINAAGKTHSREIPNIDGCIESPEMRRTTVQVNAIGAANVAFACAEYGAKLVHLSSGCIFDGEGTFTETSQPNPPSWYAKTKVLGEQLVQAANPDALILRIRMPISAEPHPRNLITKLAHATHVIDVVNSVTVVEDLLPLTDTLLECGTTGIVHAVNPEPVWFRFLMGLYGVLVDPAHRCAFIPKEEYRTADGRSNCVLSTTRTDVPPMPNARLSLYRTLDAYAGVAA